MFTSYLLLVWSEWDGILSSFKEMHTSIKEDFVELGKFDPPLWHAPYGHIV